MILGIDLGTTNSSAAIIKNSKPHFIEFNNGSKMLLSLVAFDNDGEIIVGEAAKKQLLNNPSSCIKSVKSFMGTSKIIKLRNPKDNKFYSFSAVDISSLILKEIKLEAEKNLKIEIKDVVITVPAYFGEKARQDTIKAGEKAGLNVLRIINEPTAAALCYSIFNRELDNYKLMIYDIGGGTFDISMVEINRDIVEVIASEGDRRLGGDDIDKAIYDFIKSEIVNNELSTISENFYDNLLLESEKAKISLSNNKEYSFNFKEINYKRTLTFKDFDKLLEKILLKTLNHCLSVIEKSNVKNEEIEKILLVGGSSRIPFIKNMLEKNLGVMATYEVNPDLAVVSGAAIQASIIEGNGLDSILIDVAPHSLSVSCIIEKNGKTIPNYCTKIIKKNTPLPYSIEEVFSPLNDDQENVRIAIYQGESDFEENNNLIKEYNFSNLKNSKNSKIIVNFSYDLDGTVGIDISEEGTQNKLLHKLNLGSRNSGTNKPIFIN